MSSVIVKFNFKKRSDLAHSVFKTVSDDIQVLLESNPDLFFNKENIYMSYDIKVRPKIFNKKGKKQIF